MPGAPAATRLTLACCWALGFAPLTAPADTAAPALQVWVSTSWGPPFLLPQSGPPGEPRRGLIPDWYAAPARALGQPLAITYVPPLRLAQDGAAHQDLRCFGARAWVPAGVVSWYENAARPFLAIEEVLVGHGGSPVVHDLARLQGRRIGAVAGYRYPALEAAFDSGRLLRDNAPNELAMLRKQLRGHTDYAVIRRWTLEHMRQLDPQWRALAVMPLTVSHTDLFCGVRRGGPLPLATLEAAQARLLRSGALEQLLAAYGLSR